MTSLAEFELAPPVPPLYVGQDKNMPLDPDIIAKYWLVYWDHKTDPHEKELCAWIDDAIRTAIDQDADYAFSIVEAIHAADSEQRFTEVFAAGPVEDLLTRQDLVVIDRIEEKARQDSTFAHVLGGVWQNGMSQEAWDRLKSVRKVDRWADASEK